MRAIVISLIGKDGRRAKVIFDRFGQNSEVFHDRTDDQAIAQATSNALGAVIRDPRYGSDWTANYSVTTV